MSAPKERAGGGGRGGVLAPRPLFLKHPLGAGRPFRAAGWSSPAARFKERLGGGVGAGADTLGYSIE